MQYFQYPWRIDRNSTFNGIVTPPPPPPPCKNKHETFTRETNLWSNIKNSD